MHGFWDFFWFMLSTFFFLAYLLLLFQILGDLLRDHTTSGGAKALWVLGLLIVPMLTALAYLIVRGQGMAERSLRSAQSAHAATEDYIKSLAGGSPADEIAKAKALLDAGAITDVEFVALKSKVLA